MYNFICWNTPGVLSFILMTICSVKKWDAKFAFSLNLTQIFKRTALDTDRGIARHKVILFLQQNSPRWVFLQINNYAIQIVFIWQRKSLARIGKWNRC